MSQFDVERLLLMTGANGARGPESEPCLKAQSPPAQGEESRRRRSLPCVARAKRGRAAEGERRSAAWELQFILSARTPGAARCLHWFPPM